MQKNGIMRSEHDTTSFTDFVSQVPVHPRGAFLVSSDAVLEPVPSRVIN